MAAIIDELMNREVLSVRPGERADVVLDAILGFGVTALPVLGPDRMPVGVVSLRDLTGQPNGAYHVSTPAVILRAGTTLPVAARMLAEGGYHHVVVVDPEGRAVGMLSAVDVLRGLVGVPSAHPPAFPGFDAEHGVFWSRDAAVDMDHIALAPEGPGVFALVEGAPGRPDVVVWAEACDNVQRRLLELLTAPTTETAHLARLLEREHLRFRAASVEEPARRRQLAMHLRVHLEHQTLPQAAAIVE